VPGLFADDRFSLHNCCQFGYWPTSDLPDLYGMAHGHSNSRAATPLIRPRRLCRASDPNSSKGPSYRNDSQVSKTQSVLDNKHCIAISQKITKLLNLAVDVLNSLLVPKMNT